VVAAAEVPGEQAEIEKCNESPSHGREADSASHVFLRSAGRACSGTGRGQTHSLDEDRKAEGYAVLRRVGSQGEMRVVEVAVIGD